MTWKGDRLNAMVPAMPRAWRPLAPSRAGDESEISALCPGERIGNAWARASVGQSTSGIGYRHAKGVEEVPARVCNPWASTE